MDITSIVNGWQIRTLSDGTFCVWGSDTYRAGPFPTAEQAMAAALRLPSQLKVRQVKSRRPRSSAAVLVFPGRHG